MILPTFYELFLIPNWGIDSNLPVSCINSYIWIYRLIFFPFFFKSYTSF